MKRWLTGSLIAFSPLVIALASLALLFIPQLGLGAVLYTFIGFLVAFLTASYIVASTKGRLRSLAIYVLIAIILLFILVIYLLSHAFDNWTF
ncbi:MAG TPA: hypothetical protein VLF91_04985 [Candidatus Saccharimonadales bacterium]|nr:hypothetical protein [Candidatus Saccharimonadales bacterium]